MMRLKNIDVAKELGISATAVSLALNNKPGVSAAMRQKILDFVSRETKETWQAMSSSMPLPYGERHGDLVLCVHKKHGLVMADNPFFSGLIESVQLEAARHGYAVTLANYTPGQDVEEYFEYIDSLKTDGLIVVATEIMAEDLEYYQKLRLPLVLLDGSIDGFDVDAVELDNQASIYRAFSYAYGLGHRDIGYLKSKVFINNFGHRLDGFYKGIRNFHLEDRKQVIISLPCNVEQAYDEMKKYLRGAGKRIKLPTVFLSDLDYIAFGAMRALKEEGYRIPEDISIIGYDNVAACEASEPPLTTVSVNQKNIGKVAVDRLLERIRNSDNYYTTIQISSELMIRNSVKDLR